MNELKFGVFDHLDRGGRSIADLYEQRLQIIEQYEKLGLYSYHVAEHHSTPLGMAPSPSVFLSAVAQRTTKLRFGPLVYLLPLYHPLRLAEEIAMLDQMSNGRLDVGVGRGRSPIELALYDCSFADAQGIYEEVLSILKLAFTQERIDFTGSHFKFRDVPVELRPLQRPHPPFWYGVGAPESAEAVAKDGFHAVTLARPAAATAIARRFHQASARAGHAGKRMGICRFVVVGETDQEARALAHRAYPVWHASFFELFRRYGQKPVQVWSGDFDVMAADGLAVAGSPQTVVAALADQLETVGANYLVSQLVFGDMSPGESAKSVALFGSKVMPELIRIGQAIPTMSAAQS